MEVTVRRGHTLTPRVLRPPGGPTAAPPPRPTLVALKPPARPTLEGAQTYQNHGNSDLIVYMTLKIEGFHVQKH